VSEFERYLWYSIHALLGAILGFITACIFLLIYYGQVYDVPVPESLRFKSAVITTCVIVLVSVCCYFYKPIISELKQVFKKEEE